MGKAPKKSSDQEPAFDQSVSLSGGILDPEAIDNLKLAARIAFPQRGNAISLKSTLGFCPMPPISRFEDLLDLSWSVLEGNPTSTKRFRKILNLLRTPEKRDPSTNLFGNIEERLQNLESKEFLSDREKDSGAVIQMFRQSIPKPGGGAASGCMLKPGRFLPFAAAALRISSTPLERIRSLAAIEDALCGLQRAEDLLAAGENVLNGSDPRRFRGLANFWGGGCGPDDGPIPDPFPTPDPQCPPGIGPPQDNSCWVERNHCLFGLLDAYRETTSGSGESYHITAINPATACPGDTVTLTGTNFTDSAGVVNFTSVSGSAVRAEVLSWKDTEIKVKVPDSAGSGPVYLKISESQINVCGTRIPVFKEGNSRNVTIDNARILRLSIDGKTSDLCIEPGKSLEITWSATHSGVSLRMENADGSLLEERNGLSRSGSLSTFSAPASSTETTIKIIASVSSSCGDHELEREIRVTVAPELTIEGAEFTQGVQRFWRTGITPNSLPTIAGKDTILRVYVSSDRNGFANDEVEITGIVHINGLPLHPINGINPNNSSGNPFITARRKDLIVRQQTNHTLNFRIPSHWCTGTQDVRIKIMTTEKFCTYPVIERFNTSRSWQTNTALRVRYVRIRDDSRSPATPRPSEDQCLFSVQRAFDLLPSPATDIAPAWRPTWNTDLDFRNDDDDLIDLLNDLNDEHNCGFWESIWGWTGWTDCPDDDNAIWVGFSRNFNRGMAKRPGNTCISAIYADSNGATATLRIKTAHEIGHNLSMCHIDVGGAKNTCYDHPNNGNLQDVPFDPYWNQTISSGVTDFMGYGSPRWSSADSWQRMMNFI